MVCTTCGAHVPDGRSRCDTCGAVPDRTGLSASPPMLQRSRAVGPALLSCLSCGYSGEGLPYFSRGTNTALLIGAGVATMPFFAAGGIAYYLACRDHLVCPRCGRNWGRLGARAGGSLPVSQRNGALRPADPPAELIPAETGGMGGAIILGILATIFLSVGIAELELILLLFGLASAAGSYLLVRRNATAREERRAALLAGLQLPLLTLASQRGGRLTVSEAAAALGWTIPRTEKVLQSLDDGWRVDSVVTDEGRIVYLFHELMPNLGTGEAPRSSSRPEGEDPN
jgi:hypothetical protein